MIPAATANYYVQQQRLTVLTLAHTRREWAQMGNEFDASWATVGPRVRVLTAASQLAAAKDAALYVPRVLRETGQADDLVGKVNPRAFIDVAGDGRSLEGLLQRAVVEAKTAVGQGADPAQALAQGGRWLDMAVQTAVADTGRAATSVEIAARPKITGYVRMLNTPSCSRCVVLAGKWYGWKSDFLRHPRCDCRHIPATESHAKDLRVDPKAYFDSLSPAEQSRIFTNAGAKAVNDGADLASVVNVRLGMRTARIGGQDVLTTRVGAKGRKPRLMPEAIYKAAGSRSEAIELLRSNGYLL